MAEQRVPSPPPRRRLALFYVGLAALAAVAVGAVIAASNSADAEKEIAGGYDLRAPNPCLGSSFDLKQSGQFVGLDGTDNDVGGKLRFKDERLTGRVTCATGSKGSLDARATDDQLSGEAAGRSFVAERRRDPPPPGPPPHAPASVTGNYKLAPQSTCLGGRISLKGGSGSLGLFAEGRRLGDARYAKGKLTGRATCRQGGPARLTGEAADRDIRLQVMASGGVVERIVASKQREFSNTLAAFFLAVVVIMGVAKLLGTVATKVRQPRVMGEVVAGIVLGPTLLGAIAPGIESDLFPKDIIPFIGVVANLGLIFYMFLIGLEIDPSQLRGRIGQAVAISNASVMFPMALGLAVAIPIYSLLGPDTRFAGFALFMGVAMSVTAFPVLARILVERRMLKGSVGSLTLACAAIDDVTAWFLIALATAVAVAGSGSEVIRTILLAIVFCLLMVLGTRRVLARLSDVYDQAGRVPGGWIAAIFAGVLLSAYATEKIGIALIFGAFVMGLVMPRHAELTEDVTRRLEDFVVTLLLPLFFAFTGLRTNVGLLDRGELWLLTLALIGIAVLGKLFGAMIAARLTGFGWRPSAVIGTLMNTRGLTELIVLNLALEKGIISEALFTMLVIMALVTTLMAGPMLRLLDPRNEFGEPVEEELSEAKRRATLEFPEIQVPERAILLAPLTDRGLSQLLSLAEPLARSEPPRELIIARLVRPPVGAAVRGGLQTENKLLREASAQVAQARDALIARGIAARGVAFISANAGQDLSRLASTEQVDLLLVDGQRPLLGGGVPRGEVGEALREVESDVAVLVAKETAEVLPSAEAPLVVPFGGAEHDWAALELGAWISSATGAPLKLLGAAGDTDERSRVTRLLGDAGLLVQQYAGVVVAPVIAEPGQEGVVEAARDAGLLVVGLSDRWRQEGLGPTRSEIARAAPAPVLFVRRGVRPGALAPRSDVTRFTWSMPGVGGKPITDLKR